jgi:hypothetical protein
MLDGRMRIGGRGPFGDIGRELALTVDIGVSVLFILSQATGRQKHQEKSCAHPLSFHGKALSKEPVD